MHVLTVGPVDNKSLSPDEQAKVTLTPSRAKSVQPMTVTESSST